MRELAVDFISFLFCPYAEEMADLFFQASASPLPCLFSITDNHYIQFEQNDHVAVNGIHDPYVL